MELSALLSTLILTPIYYFALAYLSIVLLLALPALSLFLLSTRAPTNPFVSFYYRTFASFLALLLTTTFGAFYALVTYPLGLHRSAQHVAGHAFAQLVTLWCGIRFHITDPQGATWLTQTRPCVIVGNHQSELDVALLGEIFPRNCSITAKRSLKLTPFLGQFMALSGTIFIDRSNRDSAMKMFEGAANEMRRHRQSVFIFPEGTRSYARDPALMNFKKGAFHLAIKAQVPILPVVAANYAGVFSHGGGVLPKVFQPGTIPVSVLEPIPTAGMSPSDVDDLVRTTRQRMLDELVRISRDTTMGRAVGTADDGSGTADGGGGGGGGGGKKVN